MTKIFLVIDLEESPKHAVLGAYTTLEKAEQGKYQADKISEQIHNDTVGSKIPFSSSCIIIEELLT